MKSIAVLFFGMLLWTQSAFASHADISFFTKRGELFQVLLDGRLINRHVTDQIHLQAIPAGYHVAEIRLPGRYGALVSRSKMYVQPGFKTDFLIQVVGRRPQIVVSKVREYPLPIVGRPVPGPGYGDPYHRDRDYPGSYPDNDYRDHDYRDHDYRGDDHRDREDYRNRVMAPSEIDRLVGTLAARPFDDDKLTLARQVLGQSTFYAEDLKRVLNQFSFDNRKLELAKALYPNVYDRRYFYVVYDAFRFESDRRELERYVSSYR